ncbi:MAG: DNA-3-methyladenine glycosylase [Myxococcales bacterium]
MVFSREFYAQPARDVARQLLGARLVRRLGPRRRAVGRVVEVEAYLGPHDLACHARAGRTARTEVMFGPPGRAYVFLVYGMHHCLNVVTDPEGWPAAVLIRALEPLEGIRGGTSGPGRLCRALSIDRSLNGADLRGGELFLEPGTRPPRVRATARIGVDYAGRWARRRLRFLDADSPHVSGGRNA